MNALYSFSIKKILFLLLLIPAFMFMGCGSAPSSGDPGVGPAAVNDGDLDAVEDTADNCPAMSNPGQEDLDSDGLGDVCDDDADGDTYLASVDDCDDLNAAAHPGLADFPDTAFLDANCDGIDGDLTAAIWVAGSGNDATGDGSIANPYKTLQKGVSEALLDTSKDVYVAEGTYTQPGNLLLKGVRVFGGYGPEASGLRPRDPSTHVSLVNGVATYGLFTFDPSLTGHDSIVSGFQVTGGLGFGGFAVGAGNPIIEGNTVYVPDHAGQYSFGFVVLGSTAGNHHPIFRNNELQIGKSTHVNGASLGMVIVSSTAGSQYHVTLENNTFQVDSGTMLTGGIVAWSETPLAQLRLEAMGNQINLAPSPVVAGISLGFGLSSGSITPTKYYTNATLSRNTIIGDDASPTGNFFGILFNQDLFSETSLLRNNMIISGLGTLSLGAYVRDAKVDVYNNTFIANSTTSQIGIYASYNGALVDTEVSVINNIIASSQPAFGVADIALLSNHAQAHFVDIQNNLIQDGFPFLFHDSSGTLPNATNLPALNGMASASNNLLETPSFMDPANNDYHLANSSAPGVDAGLDLAEVTVDIDGQDRNDGALDIGADEVLN